MDARALPCGWCDALIGDHSFDELAECMAGLAGAMEEQPDPDWLWWSPQRPVETIHTGSYL